MAEMAENEKTSRRNCVPILHVRGTHYEVGFGVGKTFKSMIQSYVCLHGPLNNTYIPLYHTTEGKRGYDLTLAAVKKSFPQYLEEMQGTAEGAGVPFFKLFLLHMDEILPSSIHREAADTSTGCSTICCNIPGQELLGHNEDALAETLEHFYFVSAHVIRASPQGRWKVKEEKFTSLCYAGMLPGFTMNYNHHGFVYSVNVIRAANMQAGKTPRTILARALLAAESFPAAEEILKDSGTGIGDAASINMIFLKEKGSRVFYNVEVAPSESPATDSLTNVVSAGPGEHIYHCNRFLRLHAPEAKGALKESSQHREAAMNALPVPKCCSDAQNILGDRSDKEFPLFREKGMVRTIATGIFNLANMTWSIYTDNPKNNDPIVELPILIELNSAVL